MLPPSPYYFLWPSISNYIFRQEYVLLCVDNTTSFPSFTKCFLEYARSKSDLSLRLTPRAITSSEFSLMPPTKRNKDVHIIVRAYLTENPVRDIDAIKEMEALKYQYQIRCSHYELEFFDANKYIRCAICGKNWYFVKSDNLYSSYKEIYMAERES